MYMRYYDSYPAPSPRRIETAEETEQIKPQEVLEEIKEAETVIQSASAGEIAVTGKKGFLHSFEADDIILIALIFILLSESDDIIMLLIIGYLLLGDILPI